MRKNIVWISFVLSVASLIARPDVVYAGQIEATDTSIVWQAGIDGVEIEWGTDGSFNRIYSRYSQAVEFPDRRGIHKAQVIAEEKAKAAIIRYLDQSVASARVVTEVDNDIGAATLTKGTNQAEDVRKSTQRQMISSLTEVTSSVAAGSLRGVIVLERGYDDREEQAWVKVGISKKSMAASKALGEALDDDEDEKPAVNQPGPDSDGDPGSEVQTYKKDW